MINILRPEYRNLWTLLKKPGFAKKARVEMGLRWKGTPIMNINEPVSVYLYISVMFWFWTSVFATHHQSLQLSTARRLIEKGHPQDPNLSVYCCLIVCRAESHHAHLLLLSLLGIYVNAKNVPDTRNLAGGKGEANDCFKHLISYSIRLGLAPCKNCLNTLCFGLLPQSLPAHLDKKCSKWMVPGGQVSQRQ